MWYFENKKNKVMEEATPVESPIVNQDMRSEDFVSNNFEDVNAAIEAGFKNTQS